VVVVATAIWLRSRFIIVANFAIYLGILACYVAVAGQERGISLGFGVVALLSARLLGWKQERLALKTELMRNAYLIAAFFIFPYALYHLVPGAWVGLAWVGAALLYYLIAAFLHNRKYRWLEPVFRNLSFLVLGAVLLVVSLVFTRLRTRR
jgi:Zn-dependent protease with chaperone function